MKRFDYLRNRLRKEEELPAEFSWENVEEGINTRIGEQRIGNNKPFKVTPFFFISASIIVTCIALGYFLFADQTSEKRRDLSTFHKSENSNTKVFPEFDSSQKILSVESIKVETIVEENDENLGDDLYGSGGIEFSEPNAEGQFSLKKSEVKEHLSIKRAIDRNGITGRSKDPLASKGLAIEQLTPERKQPGLEKEGIRMNEETGDQKEMLKATRVKTEKVHISEQIASKDQDVREDALKGSEKEKMLENTSSKYVYNGLESISNKILNGKDDGSETRLQDAKTSDNLGYATNRELVVNKANLIKSHITFPRRDFVVNFKLNTNENKGSDYDVSTPRRKLFLEVGGGINYWSFGTSRNTIGQEKSRYEKALPGYTMTAKMGYHFTPAFSISVGIDYLELESKLERDFIREYNEIQENVLIEVIVNPINSGRREIFGDTSISVTETRSVVHFNQLQVISIPLIANLHVPINSLELYGGIGASISFIRQQKGRVSFNNQILDFRNEAPIYNTSARLALRGEVGVKYLVTDKLYFGGKINFNQSINSWSSLSDLIVNPRISTLNAMIGLKF